MDICGHCGGMGRHREGCRFGEVAHPIHLGRMVSPHDPQHAVPSTIGSRLFMPICLGMLTVFALGLAFILKWP